LRRASERAGRARSLRRTLGVMAGYVVEVYMSRLRASTLDDLTARARQVSEELSRAGTPVVYVRSVFFPEDETCFHFFEAQSLEAIQETCSRLGLTHERIAKATSVGLSPGTNL
jgi:hypothetical protein